MAYQPTLFLLAKESTGYTTVHGENVYPITSDSIYDARAFIKRHENITNSPIYGNQRFEYAYIADNFKGDLEWDRSKILVANIDIEVDGYTTPDKADFPVTAIAYKRYNEILVFGLGDFTTEREDVRYFKFKDEEALLRGFLRIWASDYPDIITGWNVKFFDIPYLFNRITQLFGEETALTLSPWGKSGTRFTTFMGRQQTSLTLQGIAIVDYIELYRKFAKEGMQQESYKLDHIAFVEIGERKVDYGEYGNLMNLSRDNHQLFIEYNIHDVELVGRMDERGKNCAGLMDLALTLAYDSKSNYEDVFAQVRMWDAIVFNKLKQKKKVLPPSKMQEKEPYDGAYVKEPKTGMYEWVASFDLNSLYPHLIMQYNISPDCILDTLPDSLASLLAGGVSVDALLSGSLDMSVLKRLDVTITPNGQFFTRAKQGFLSEIMQDMYDGRVLYKSKMLEAEKLLQDDKTNEDLRKQRTRYSNLEKAKKVCLNSAYGALGNEFFRFFDVRQALGITSAGQLSIRWVERAINGYLNKTLGTTEKDYIIAIDTDSVYVHLGPLVDKVFGGKTATKEAIISFLDGACKGPLADLIDKAYIDLANYVNAVDQKMFMKREALCDKVIWTSKKRYILNIWDKEGVRYKEPKIKISGLEIVKSSTPQICRDKMKEAVKLILTTDQKTVINFIDKFRRDWEKLSPAEIAFPRSVKGLAKFAKKNSGIPIHVKGSLVFNEKLKELGLQQQFETIKDGTKIKFLYLRQPNPLHSHVLAFNTEVPKEFGMENYFDYDMQFEKTFLEPLKIILTPINWPWEHPKASIMDLFVT